MTEVNLIRRARDNSMLARLEVTFIMDLNYI